MAVLIVIFVTFVAPGNRTHTGVAMREFSSMDTCKEAAKFVRQNSSREIRAVECKLK
jgi:hypothetical protein